MSNNIQKIFDDIDNLTDEINNLTEEERAQIVTRIGTGRDDRINTLGLVMRKVRSHRSQEKHEGCCMHLIEDILLDYSFSNNVKEEMK